MVNLLEYIDPDYYKYFVYMDIRGIKLMYAESKNDIYVTLEASLLFWKKLYKSLEKMGYQSNEYEWCVMNKIVKAKQ